MTGFLARVGDRINPIVVKETRQAVNSRLVAGTLLLFLALQFGAMVVMVGGREVARDPDDLNLRAGREVFLFVQGILLGTCMLLIPALTGGRLAAERSDVNVDLLFISSLSPRAIMAGKLFAAASLALLIFSACAPFMTFAYVLRGLDVPTILVVLAADFLAVLTGTMFALLLASVTANRALRVILGIGGFIALCYMFAGALAATSGFLEFGFGVDMTEWEFWAGFAALAAAVLGLIGLMFVWATALISPPTANRALIVRSYTIVFWAATGLGCAAWSAHISESGPVIAWGMAGTALFCLQIAVGVSERDEWGPRVARRIPRLWVLRVPAFLFYSGAAGGIVFGVIGGADTVLGMLAWHDLMPHIRWPTRWWEPAQVAGLIVGYTYCYAMTAALCRPLLRGSGLRPEHTWVIGLMFFGLGCTLPYIVQYTFFSRHYFYTNTDEVRWLHLPNAIVTIGNTLDRSVSFTEWAVLFVAGWAAVVTLLNLRWLVRQVAQFHPPARPQPKSVTA